MIVRSGWIALIIVALAWLAAAIWGSGKGYYPCYDSGAYITVSRALLAGEGYVEGNHPEKPPFILYPPGYVVPLVGAMSVFGENWRALRLASVVPFGFAALLLIPWAFGRRLPPWQWPLAALLVGFGNVFIWSMRIQAEIPYLLWALLFAGFGHRALERERILTRELGLAILFGSIAIWTKPMGAMLPFVIALQALFVAHGRFHRSGPEDPHRWRESLTPFLVALVLGVTILTPYAIHLARVQPDVFDPAKTHVLQKNWWDPDAGQRQLLSIDNARHLWTAAGDAVRYYVPWSFLIHSESSWSERKNHIVALLGWLVLLGLVRRGLTREWDVFDGMALGQAALICAMPNQHPRYYAVVAPALAVNFMSGLTLIGDGIALVLRPFGKFQKASTAALVVIGSLPLLAYEARDVWGWREWGEAWSDRSLNVFIGEAAARRASPGDVLFVDDHYGIHAITGFPALSYHPAQRKSMTGWNVDDYLARGGRIDVVATQIPEWPMAEELFTRYGWEAYDRRDEEWYITARLRRVKSVPSAGITPIGRPP